MTDPDQPDWPDPTDAGWGREPMTVPMTRWHELSLDGQWRFHPVETPEKAHGIPEDSPIGHHHRKFDVDSELLDGQLLITLGVADCSFHLAINGDVVGYSTDCGHATTFDITAHCHQGSNTIAVRGYRWFADSDVEVSDRQRPSEFHGSVELWSRPLVHLLDVDFRADLRPDNTGCNITTKVTVGGHDPAPAESLRVAISLDDASGAELATGRAQVGVDGTVVLRFGFDAIRTWFPEDPYLHRLRVDLLTSSGELLDSHIERVGIRTVRVEGGELTLNGRAVEIRGINRSRNSDMSGFADADSMRRDIVLMKQHNINAVRFANYPSDHRFLELCDGLGMFVFADASVACHRDWEQLVDDPEQEAQFVDHVARMVERDKNRACVVAWTLGAGRSYGRNHDVAASWVRSRDSSRPIMFDPAGLRDSVDIVSPMYPSADHLALIGRTPDQDRPVIMGAYAHSSGSLDEYWETIRRTTRLQGGFIGDWTDPDAHGAMTHLKFVYQPIGFELTNGRKGIVRITNRQQWLDLAMYDFNWGLESNGRETQSGSIDVASVPAGCSREFELGYNAQNLVPNHEHWVTISATRRARTTWAARGHELAFGQFQVHASGRRRPTPTPAFNKTGRIDRGDSTIWEAHRVSITIDHSTGSLSGFAVAGREMISRGLVPCVWRERTDNEAPRDEEVLALWRQAGYDRLEHEVTGVIHHESGSVRVDHRLHLPDSGVQFVFCVDYRLFASGTLLVEARFHAEDRSLPLPTLPRIGQVGGLIGELTGLTWFGPGPGETYSDRWTGSRIGQHSGTVDSGNHHAARWIACRDEAGDGLMITAGGQFDFDVTQTPDGPLETTGDLVVHVDAAHRGVGNG